MPLYDGRTHERLVRPHDNATQRAHHPEELGHRCLDSTLDQLRRLRSWPSSVMDSAEHDREVLDLLLCGHRRDGSDLRIVRLKHRDLQQILDRPTQDPSIERIWCTIEVEQGLQ